MLGERVKQIANVMLQQRDQGKPVTQDAIAQLFNDRYGTSFSNSTYTKANRLYKNLIRSPHLGNSELVNNIGRAAMIEMLSVVSNADAVQELAQNLTEAVAKNKRLEAELEALKQAIESMAPKNDELALKVHSITQRLQIVCDNLEKKNQASSIVNLLKEAISVMGEVSGSSRETKN